MNESGATVWEVRELANNYRGAGSHMNPLNIHSEYFMAIIHEALNCLVDKKEAERRAA